MKLTEQKRQDILDAAIKEFEVQGFVAARVSNIAKMANVSSRTFYKHFANKEALFEHIVEKVFGEIVEAPLTDYDPDVPLKRQLIQAVNDYIDMITGEAFLKLNRIMMSEFLRSPEIAKSSFENHTISDGSVQHIIEQAMEAGVLRKEEPFYAAHQLISQIKAYFCYPQFIVREDWPWGKERDEIIADCVDMFLKHY